MARRICLSIGVSTVKPGPNGQAGFAVLDGAIPAAKSIEAWAVAAGFGGANVATVTDERTAGAVTVDRVRNAVALLFPNGAETVEHMILSFCGHGMTGAEVDSMFWLFSDALEQQYCVNVNEFVVEFLKYGVPRITLISDACRDGPSDLDLQRLEGRRVIVGPGKAAKSPQFDRLAASQDGKTSFMVGDKGSALPGKCIFSGVITDILWKREASAIVDGAVTTLGLGATARSRATERASNYSLELYPQCLVDPLPAVLVSAGQDLPPEANPQPWPEIGEGQIMGDLDLDHVHVADVVSPEHAIERISGDIGFRNEILGINFGKALPDLDFTRNFSGFPDDAARPLLDLIKLRTVSAADDQDAETRMTAAARAEEAVKRLEAKAAPQARQQVATQLREMVKHLTPWNDMPDVNLVTLGVKTSQIWGAEGTTIEHYSKSTEDLSFWRITPCEQSQFVVIETGDRFFVPVTLYDGLYATVSPDPRGGYVLAYGSSDESRGIEEVFQVIADLAAGKLSPADLDKLAAHLRNGKHVDPILGVISAYLYRAIADVDSIRRMAYFYKQYNQAVPFDIALLGDMTVTGGTNGKLVAHVPEVQDRKGLAGHLPEYMTRATPAVSFPVGGRTPWLSVGWDYVVDPAPEWAPLVAGLAPFARDVTRSGFTNLPWEAGNQFLAMCHLRPVRFS